MMTVSVKINCPSNVVWDYFTTISNWSKWYGGGVKEVTPSWQQGADIVWELGGTSHITRFVPGQEIGLSGAWMDTTYKFAREGDSVTIVTVIESDPKPGASFNDGGAAHRSRIEDTLQKFKRLVEGGVDVKGGTDVKSGTDAKKEGLRLFDEGLYEEATQQFGEAQELFAAEGNELEAAEMVNNLGVTYRLLQRWDDARTALEEAQAAFARLGDRNREAQVLANLGGLLSSQGERLKAQEYLRRAADLFTELGDQQRQGETLMALGVQMWRGGDRRGGLAVYQAGLFALERPHFRQKALRRLLELADRLSLTRV